MQLILDKNKRTDFLTHKMKLSLNRLDVLVLEIRSSNNLFEFDICPEIGPLMGYDSINDIKNISYRLTFDYVIKESLVPNQYLLKLLWKGKVKGLNYLTSTEHIKDSGIYIYAIQQKLFTFHELFIKNITFREYQTIKTVYAIDIEDFICRSNVNKFFVDFVSDYIDDIYITPKTTFKLLDSLNEFPERQKNIINKQVSYLFHVYTFRIYRYGNAAKLHIINQENLHITNNYLTTKILEYKFLMELAMTNLMNYLGFDPINKIWKLIN